MWLVVFSICLILSSAETSLNDVDPGADGDMHVWTSIADLLRREGDVRLGQRQAALGTGTEAPRSWASNLVTLLRRESAVASPSQDQAAVAVDNVEDHCYDTEAMLCVRWAASGECGHSRNWMRSSCSRSCGHCGSGLLQGRRSTALSTALARAALAPALAAEGGARGAVADVPEAAVIAGPRPQALPPDLAIGSCEATSGNFCRQAFDFVVYGEQPNGYVVDVHPMSNPIWVEFDLKARGTTNGMHIVSGVGPAPSPTSGGCHLTDFAILLRSAGWKVPANMRAMNHIHKLGIASGQARVTCDGQDQLLLAYDPQPQVDGVRLILHNAASVTKCVRITEIAVLSAPEPALAPKVASHPKHVASNVIARDHVFEEAAKARGSVEEVPLSRPGLLEELYELLDADHNQRLKSADVLRMAKLLDFKKGQADWALAWVGMCRELKVNPETGFDKAQFREMMLNTMDDNLRKLVARLLLQVDAIPGKSASAERARLILDIFAELDQNGNRCISGQEMWRLVIGGNSTLKLGGIEEWNSAVFPTLCDQLNVDSAKQCLDTDALAVFVDVWTDQHLRFMIASMRAADQARMPQKKADAAISARQIMRDSAESNSSHSSSPAPSPSALHGGSKRCTTCLGVFSLLVATLVASIVA